MPGVSAVNRALTRLDGALRSQKISLDEFRSRRARLIQDFEDGSSVTEPEALVEDLVDPDITAEVPTRPSPASEVPADVQSRQKNLGVIAAAVIVGIIALLSIGWLMLGRNEPPAAEQTGPADSAQSLPLEAVNQLLDSHWAPADIEQFLVRWSQFEPAAVNAVRDDPRLWLLRGEIENQLREARDAQSLGEDPELNDRIALIDRLQDAVRSP